MLGAEDIGEQQRRKNIPAPSMPIAWTIDGAFGLQDRSGPAARHGQARCRVRAVFLDGGVVSVVVLAAPARHLLSAPSLAAAVPANRRA